MATKQTKTPGAGPATKGLRVVARPDSFWRGGLQFTKEPRTIPLSELTPAQVEEITEEPLLVVTEVDIEVAAQ